MDTDPVYFSGGLISVNPPQVRLWVHRIKKFLLEIAKSINIPMSILSDAVSDSVQIVLGLIPNKNSLGASLYDLALAAFWDRLTSYGIVEVSIHRLIRIAKTKLRHKVTHGKVLKVLAFLKESRNDLMDFDERVRFYVKLIVNRFFEQSTLKQKLQGVNTAAIKNNLLLITARILDRIREAKKLEGSPKVLAGVMVYLACRLCNNVVPIAVSSSFIEHITGVNKFTILRRYRQVLDALTRDANLIRMCSLE